MFQPTRLSKLTLTTSTPSAKKKKKRSGPLNELIITEEKYLDNLIMVRDKFREPVATYLLQRAGAAGSVVQLDQIFYKLDELIQLHSEISAQIKPKRADVGLAFSRNIQR